LIPAQRLIGELMGALHVQISDSDHEEVLRNVARRAACEITEH
jgi:hypothetical protein